MEENKSLSFDQLPSAVGELLTKVNTMMTRLDDIGQRIGNAPSENDHVLMDIREASAFVRKKVSSLYAYTSERRIPFYKRGNTLYFFKDQLIKWIEAGGSWDKPYESTQYMNHKTINRFLYYTITVFINLLNPNRSNSQARPNKG